MSEKSPVEVIRSGIREGNSRCGPAQNQAPISRLNAPRQRHGFLVERGSPRGHGLRRFAKLPRCDGFAISPEAPLRCPRLYLKHGQGRLMPGVSLIPPSQPGADQFPIQVSPIRQDDLSDGSFVAIHIPHSHRHDFAEGQISVNCFARVPNACFDSGQSIPQSRMRSARLLCMTLIVSPSVIATTLPAKSSARARTANATKTSMRENASWWFYRLIAFSALSHPLQGRPSRRRDFNACSFGVLPPELN